MDDLSISIPKENSQMYSAPGGELARVVKVDTAGRLRSRILMILVKLDSWVPDLSRVDLRSSLKFDPLVAKRNYNLIKSRKSNSSTDWIYIISYKLLIGLGQVGLCMTSVTLVS